MIKKVYYRWNGDNYYYFVIYDDGKIFAYNDRYFFIGVYSLEEDSDLIEDATELKRKRETVCPICGEKKEIKGRICDECLEKIRESNFQIPRCPICKRQHLSMIMTHPKVTKIHYSKKEVVSRECCVYCAKYEYFVCNKCNKLYKFEYSDGVLIKGYYYCGRCYPNKFPVRRYSYKPAPLYYFINQKEYFMGFELEIEFKELEQGVMRHLRSSNKAYRYYSVLAEKALKIKRYLRKLGLKDFIYLKMDASVGGFELVSHPFTFEWYKKNKQKIEKLFKYIKKIDGISYTTGHCGLHIHITKPPKEEIRKIWYFCQTKYRYITKIAQRGSQHYCYFPTYSFYSGIRLHLFRDTYRDYILQSHYHALNILSGITLEFRFFRGTLNFKVFSGIITFVEAIRDFCKTHSLAYCFKCSWQDFIKFAKENYYHDLVYLWNKIEKRMEQVKDNDNI